MAPRSIISQLFLQVTLLLLALSDDVKGNGESDEQCKCGKELALKPRPHSVSILEFGAVGDGKTLNTIAFQNAVFYLRSFADKGGAQLYVPPGRWLTGSFNLTSHLTLFLERNAVILGTQVSHFVSFTHDSVLHFSLCFFFSVFSLHCILLLLLSLSKVNYSFLDLRICMLSSFLDFVNARV